MPARLVALDEGPDITLDRAMIVVGRHPQCDARLDSLRVSRHHCCMTTDHGEVVVRDLGSTNGIRINGHRVELGRLKPGDELSIAHIRYRLDSGQGHEATLADSLASREPIHHPAEAAVAAGLAPVVGAGCLPGHAYGAAGCEVLAHGIPDEKRLAAAFREALAREALPPHLADRYRIQVIVQMPGEGAAVPGENGAGAPVAEEREACRPDSSH